MKRAAAAIILCVLVTSASCGGRSDGGIDDSLPASPTSVQPRDDESDGGIDDSLPASPTSVRPGDDEEAPFCVAGPLNPEQSRKPASHGDGQTANAYDIVLGILYEHCGACHGRPSDAEANAVPGPLEFTDDIDRMVALGIIEPLNGAFSPLVQVMVDGSMPPLECGPGPVENDVTLIRQWIDNPNYWRERPPAE